MCFGNRQEANADSKDSDVVLQADPSFGWALISEITFCNIAVLYSTLRLISNVLVEGNVFSRAMAVIVVSEPQVCSTSFKVMLRKISGNSSNEAILKRTDTALIYH